MQNKLSNSMEDVYCKTRTAGWSSSKQKEYVDQQQSVANRKSGACRCLSSFFCNASE